MPVDEAWLRELAARAANLAERLSGVVEPDPRPGDEALIGERLQRWKARAAKGNEAAFARRLAWDGLDEDRVRPRLGNVKWPDDAPLPPWTDTLRAVLSESWDPLEDTPFLPADPVPFEEAFIPFLRVARRRLGATAGAAHGLFLPEAHRALEGALLRRLGQVAGRTLFLEFSVLRSLRESPTPPCLGEPRPTETSGHYAAFLDQLRRGGLRDLFTEYPVLARLLSTVLEFWVASSAELLHRLEADLPDLRARFGLGVTLPVAALQPALSDPHQGGRSVAILTFESSLRLVYKPKDLGMEEAWFGLLGWLNEHAGLLPLRVLNILNRGTHGWAECVKHAPCEDLDGVRRYYQRAGMLLCLVWLLEGIDGHHENLIAEGEHPVLVDLETLLHPRLFPPIAGLEAMEGSIHRTGLLPPPIELPSHFSPDVSGFGSLEPLEFQEPIPTLRFINQDHMELVLEQARKPALENRPHHSDGLESLQAYSQDLAHGFESMGEWVLSHRKALTSEGGPMDAFVGAPSRVVFRPTQLYSQLQARSLAPKVLEEGSQRSLGLEPLFRAALPPHERYFPFLGLQEIMALEQLDIPYFVAGWAPGPGIIQHSRNPNLNFTQLDKGSINRQLQFIQDLTPSFRE